MSDDREREEIARACVSWSSNGRGCSGGRFGMTCKSRTSNGSNSWR